MHPIAGGNVEGDAVAGTEQPPSQCHEALWPRQCLAAGETVAQQGVGFLLERAVVGRGACLEAGVHGGVDAADQQAGHRGLPTFASRRYQIGPSRRKKNAVSKGTPLRTAESFRYRRRTVRRARSVPRRR